MAAHLNTQEDYTPETNGLSIDIIRELIGIRNQIQKIAQDTGVSIAIQCTELSGDMMVYTYDVESAEYRTIDINKFKEYPEEISFRHSIASDTVERCTYKNLTEVDWRRAGVNR